MCVLVFQSILPTWGWHAMVKKFFSWIKRVACKKEIHLLSHENNSKNDEEEDDLGGAADDVSYVKECCHLNFLVEMLLVILLQYWKDLHLIGTKWKMLTGF